MPVIVPSGPNPAQNGLPDSAFIAKVRRILRDQAPIFAEKYPTDSTTGGVVAGAKPFKLMKQPVMFNSVLLTAPGGPWVIDYNDAVLPPPAGHVNINTDTGEILFSTAPPSGVLAVTYQAARFSDAQITDALYEGMNNLWPEIWNPVTDTTSLFIGSPIQFEYALNAIFGDQRTIILDVEYSPPDGIIRYLRTSMWHQTQDINNPTLVFSKLPPVASQVRLTYTKTFASLGEMPSQVQQLAVYYALAFLLAAQETMRTRSDDLQAQTAESANPAGSAIQTSAWWLQQFDAQLQRFGIEQPARATVMNRTVERLGLSNFWTDAA
jgi:hypothetical protein